MSPCDRTELLFNEWWRFNDSPQLQSFEEDLFRPVSFLHLIANLSRQRREGCAPRTEAIYFADTYLTEVIKLASFVFIEVFMHHLVFRCGS